MRYFENLSPHYEEALATAAAANASADLVTINDINVFPLLVDIANGDEYAAVVKSQKVKAKKNESLAINVGDALYFDTTAKEITKTNTNVLVGFANKPALSADTHVYMRYDGTLAFAKA